MTQANYINAYSKTSKDIKTDANEMFIDSVVIKQEGLAIANG